MLRVILPDKTYEKVNQDYLEMLLKCNIELARLTNQKSDKIDAMLTTDQLTKLTNLLIAIMTGDHSLFAFLQKQSPQPQTGNPTTP